MKKTLLTLLVLSLCACNYLFSQDAGFYFGPKAGLTIGMQNWNQSERDPLLSYHGAIFIESIDIDITSDESNDYQSDQSNRIRLAGWIESIESDRINRINPINRIGSDESNQWLGLIGSVESDRISISKIESIESIQDRMN